MELKILVLLHVLGACIWVGGHLILAIAILPRALKTRDVDLIKSFDASLERIALPALVVQILTGIRMAMIHVPSFSDWFSFSDRLGAHIGMKLILLFGTLLLAIHARLFIAPKLSAQSLPLLASHILAITLIAVAMLFVGVNFRLAILF